MSPCWHPKYPCVRSCPEAQEAAFILMAFSSSSSPALLPSEPTAILLPGFCSVHLPTTVPGEDPTFFLTVRYATYPLAGAARVSPCGGNGPRLYNLQIQKQRWICSHCRLGCAWISSFPSPLASTFPRTSALWTMLFCRLILQVSFSVSYIQRPGSAQLATDVSKPSARFFGLSVEHLRVFFG